MQAGYRVGQFCKTVPVVANYYFELIVACGKRHYQCIFVRNHAVLRVPVTELLTITYDAELSNRCYVEVTQDLELIGVVDNRYRTSLSEREDDVMVLVLIYELAQSGRSVSQRLVTLVVIPTTVERETHGIVTCCEVEHEGVVGCHDSVRRPSLICGKTCIHNQCRVTEDVILSLRCYIEVTLYFEYLTGFVDDLDVTSLSEFEAYVSIFVGIDTGSSVGQVLNTPPLVILGDEFELVRTGCEAQRQRIGVGYECALLRPCAVSFTYDIFTTGNPELSHRSYVEVTFEFEEFVGVDHRNGTRLSEREDDIIILIGAHTVGFNSQVTVALTGTPSTIHRYFQHIVTGCEVELHSILLSLQCIRMPCECVHQSGVTRDIILSRNDYRKFRILKSERVVSKRPCEGICTFYIGREDHVGIVVLGNTGCTGETTMIGIAIRTPVTTNLHLEVVGTGLDIIVRQRSTQAVSCQYERDLRLPVGHITGNRYGRDSRRLGLLGLLRLLTGCLRIDNDSRQEETAFGSLVLNDVNGGNISGRFPYFILKYQFTCAERKVLAIYLESISTFRSAIHSCTEDDRIHFH